MHHYLESKRSWTCATVQVYYIFYSQNTILVSGLHKSVLALTRYVCRFGSSLFGLFPSTSISLHISSLWCGKADSALGFRDRNFFSQSLERKPRREEFRPVSCLCASSWLIALRVFLALDSCLPSPPRPHPPFAGDYHILWDSGEIINVRHERGVDHWRRHKVGKSHCPCLEIPLCVCSSWICALVSATLALMKWVCRCFVLSAPSCRYQLRAH